MPSRLERRPFHGPQRLLRPVDAYYHWLGCHDQPFSSACDRRLAGRGDQPDPSRLQPLGDHVREPPGELVAEHRIGLAAGPDRPPVELEGLDRAGGHGTEGPPVRREQPRPAEQIAHADAVDRHPALPGHVQVERYVTGLDQPEPAGAATVFEEPVPGREGNVRGGLRENGKVIAGHVVQEWVRGESLRRDFDHGIPPPSLSSERPAWLRLSAWARARGP